MQQWLDAVTGCNPFTRPSAAQHGNTVPFRLKEPLDDTVYVSCTDLLVDRVITIIIIRRRMKEKGSYSRRSSCGRRRHRLPPLTLCICRVRWVRTLVEGFLTPCGARKDRPKLDSPNWDGLSADRGLAVFFPVSTAIIMCNNFNKYSTRNERTTNERTNERYIIALLTLHHTTTCVYVGTSWPLNWLRFFFSLFFFFPRVCPRGKRKKEREKERNTQANQQEEKKP